MKYTPLKNRVVIKPAPKKEITDGGIIIPETAERELLIEGTAAFIGSEVETIKAGDRVLYSSSSGGDISINGENHTILFETDIWSIISDR